jgi:hypothetical protein
MPNSGDDVNRFVEQAVPVVEFNTKSIEFSLQVARADNKGCPSARQHIEGGHRLGRYERVPIRQYSKPSHQVELTCRGSAERKSRERVEGLVASAVEPRSWWRGMVGERNSENVALLGCPSECSDVRRPYHAPLSRLLCTGYSTTNFMASSG